MEDVRHEVVERDGFYILKLKDHPILLGSNAKKYKSAAAAYKDLKERYPDSTAVAAEVAEKTRPSYKVFETEDGEWSVFQGNKVLKKFATSEAAHAHVEKKKAADAKKAQKK